MGGVAWGVVGGCVELSRVNTNDLMINQVWNYLIMNKWMI